MPASTTATAAANWFRLTADAELLRSAVGSTMSVALRSVVTVIGSIVMLFVTSPHWRPAPDRHPAGGAADRVGGRACARFRAPARTASPTPTRWPPKPWARCAPCRRTHASRTSAAASPAPATAVNTARKRIGAQSIVTAVAITLVFGAITLVLWSGAHDVVAGRMTAGTLGSSCCMR
jgi:ATP-binding cassette subfamily B protein